jgi:hypothetical protein
MVSDNFLLDIDADMFLNSELDADSDNYRTWIRIRIIFYWIQMSIQFEFGIIYGYRFI